MTKEQTAPLSLFGTRFPPNHGRQSPPLPSPAANAAAAPPPVAAATALGRCPCAASLCLRVKLAGVAEVDRHRRPARRRGQLRRGLGFRGRKERGRSGCHGRRCRRVRRGRRPGRALEVGNVKHVLVRSRRHNRWPLVPAYSTSAGATGEGAGARAGAGAATRAVGGGASGARHDVRCQRIPRGDAHGHSRTRARQ